MITRRSFLTRVAGVLGLAAVPFAFKEEPYTWAPTQDARLREAHIASTGEWKAEWGTITVSWDDPDSTPLEDIRASKRLISQA